MPGQANAWAFALMILRRSFRLFLVCLLVAVAVAVLFPANAHAQRRQRPPISWVKRDLPNGPGLTHKVLASKAMGHDVGYVVWTPADYDSSGKTRYPVIYFLHGMGGSESV